MAEQNQVVQAQVVQATVVGQPVGQATYPQVPYQAQGHPIGQPGPVYGGPYVQTPDQAGAQQGWLLYGIGWVLCCCFGPVGPVFWFVVACMHYCKPKEVRQNLPQEAQIACVSLWTAIVTTILTVALLILIIVSFVGVASTIQDSQSYYNYR